MKSELAQPVRVCPNLQCFFSQPSLLFSISVWLISIRALVFSLSVRLSTAGELEVGEERGLLPWNLHLKWYQVHSGSSIQQQLQNVQELRLPIFFIRVCGNFSQRVKCKADQISHFCHLVDIKERPRMCKNNTIKAGGSTARAQSKMSEWVSGVEWSGYPLDCYDY